MTKEIELRHKVLGELGFNIYLESDLHDIDCGIVYLSVSDRYYVNSSRITKDWVDLCISADISAERYLEVYNRVRNENRSTIIKKILNG